MKLETYLGLLHCRFDFAFSGAARAPITLSPKSKKLRCVKRHQKRLLVNCRSNFPGLALISSIFSVSSTRCDKDLQYQAESGLGPMYSCTLYSCTWVHILEYSDVLCTHVLLAWCTQYLYSSTFIKYSYFQSTFWVLFHRTMLLFWYQWYWWYIYTAALKHDAHCHLSGPCILLLQPYSSICVHIDLSDIMLYELSGLIVCSNKTPILWECALWWPWQWYLIGFTPYPSLHGAQEGFQDY